MKALLLSGERKVGVWGIGHIGYSTMCHFASRGVRCIGYDIDPARVKTVNEGSTGIVGMEGWLGFSPAYLFRSGVARATDDWKELVQPDVSVHFICVPTERDGAPYLWALMDVCRRIGFGIQQGRQTGVLVIIESTLVPGTVDGMVVPFFKELGLGIGRDVLLGCAPRRDWFSSADKSLSSLPRVFGGADQATTEKMRQVLSIVCSNLVEAPDHRHAELVKSVENAYRHVEIALAFELSRAYPGIDMRKVLELAGTKWNVGTFRPSFGIGGYCIPVSSLYVLDGAQRPDELGLLRLAVISSRKQPRLVAESLFGRRVSSVGILGLSYTADVKVHAHSPTLGIVEELRRRGVKVKVNDPLYSAEEIERICGVGTFAFPEGLSEFEAVLVVAAHREYRAVATSQVLRRLKCRVVLDNAGLWQDVPWQERGIEYWLAGQAGWMG